MVKQKHISVHIDTHEELIKLKAEGQSFDGVIQKLIKNYRATFLNVV